MRSKKVTWLVVTLAVLGILALAGTALAEENQNSTGPVALPQVFLDKLAAALGIDRATLDSAIQEASTATVDEAQEQGIITQYQADQIKSRIKEGGAPFWGGMDWGRGWGMMGRGGGFRGGNGFEVADLLGMSPQELRQELQSGKTLQEIAAAKGLSLDQLKQQWLARKKAELQELVSQGKLTQEKADEILSRLEKVDLSRCPFPGPKAGVDGERGRNL